MDRNYASLFFCHLLLNSSQARFGVQAGLWNLSETHRFQYECMLKADFLSKDYVQSSGMHNQEKR